MFFGKKKKKVEIKCESCNSKISEKYSFCPYCGNALFDREKEQKEFGLLGKTDSVEQDKMPVESFGITDKLISSLMNSVMKNMEKQFKNIDSDFEKAEIKTMPNGIRIKIGSSPVLEAPKKPKKSLIKKAPTNKQIEKLSKLPRTTAKSSVKRLSDKIIYELITPGIESPRDVFISKLENGYEIKAIGSKKVYVNSIQIDLPLRGLAVAKNKLLIEFNTKEK